MQSSYYSVTFEGAGSTSVKARSAEDAMYFGRYFTRRGRANVRIATSDACSFTIEEFGARVGMSKEISDGR